ncbi:hypothetical protein CRYUN_Cryun20dG0009300 [Craigia yunnanensis]
MDNERLFEAARKGNIKVLHDLLGKNPLILTDVALSCSRETPLHVAVKACQLHFVREIMKHKPEYAGEMSKDGKDQRTALHYAAANGQLEIINELISTCPKSITDVTIYGETSLHLAVKNNQFPAFSTLVKWLEKLNERPVINFRDRDGNCLASGNCSKTIQFK